MQLKGIKLSICYNPRAKVTEISIEIAGITRSLYGELTLFFSNSCRLNVRSYKLLTVVSDDKTGSVPSVVTIVLRMQKQFGRECAMEICPRYLMLWSSKLF